jgi:DNA adenine methylase
MAVNLTQASQKSILAHASVPERTDLDRLRERAQSPLSALPRPFLRWAGSKRLLLSYIIEHLPSEFGTYYEPFLGSGSLFFLLMPRRAVLSDKSSSLIGTFRAVRENPEAVLNHIASLRVNRGTYYQVRASEPRDRFERAAAFIYLNKTCWNGLYRVNSLGRFNVPYGRPKTNNIVEPDNLHACSRALRRRRVTLQSYDFAESLREVETGDLVYLDPPYVTGHTNNGFRDYNDILFSWFDQQRLASLAHSMADRGVHVIASNANHPSVSTLYHGFEKHVIQRKSTLASSVVHRGRATEAIYVRLHC